MTHHSQFKEIKVRLSSTRCIGLCVAASLLCVLASCGKISKPNRLENAIKTGNNTVVRTLVDRNPGAIDWITGGDRKPINWAVHSQNSQAVDILLKAGADPYYDCYLTGVPLNFAAYFGDTQSMAVLISHGVNVNHDPHSPKNIGETPLVNAAAGGTTRAVEILLAAGADPNLQSKGGFTPLGASLRSTRQHNNRKDIIHLLLDSGARTDVRDGTGMLPIEIAMENKIDQEIVDMLSE